MAVLALILRVLYVGPFIIFSYLLDMSIIIYIVSPIFSCILYTIICNIEGFPVTGKGLFRVLAVSLFITFIVKLLVTSCIIQMITFMGLESIILIVVDFVVGECLFSASIASSNIRRSNIYGYYYVPAIPFTLFDNEGGNYRVITRSAGWQAVNKRAEPEILEEVYNKHGSLYLEYGMMSYLIKSGKYVHRKTTNEHNSYKMGL
jgi:hypothetical protein